MGSKLPVSSVTGRPCAGMRDETVETRRVTYEVLTTRNLPDDDVCRVKRDLPNNSPTGKWQLKVEQLS